MASAKTLRSGDRVLTADGKELGTVKDVHDMCIQIKASGKRDYWLPIDSIQANPKGIVLLSVVEKNLKDASVGYEAHNGPHSHPSLKDMEKDKDKDEKKQGGGGILTSPLLILGSVAIMAMRNPKTRGQIFAFAGKLKDRGAGQADDTMKQVDDLTDDLKDRVTTTAQGRGGGNASGIGTGDLSAMKPPSTVTKDAVDETSWESFPASDPPGRY